MNHKGTVKEFQGTCTMKDAILNVAYTWNAMKAETLCQAWRKLWPAVMFAEGASDEKTSRDLMSTTKTQFMKWLKF
jgi:hypothetical protein